MATTNGSTSHPANSEYMPPATNVEGKRATVCVLSGLPTAHVLQLIPR